MLVRSRWLAVLLITLLAATLCAAQLGSVYETNIPANDVAIGYWEQPLHDRLSKLAAELAAGSTTLEFDDRGLGYLPSLFAKLGVAANSQTLVYSKTSLQQAVISPSSPRAIYFSDDVTIAFVPDGDAIEMAALDPRQGVVLYRLANRKTPAPLLTRPKLCLACHQAPATLGVPGLYVGSVLTTPSGRPQYQGSLVTDHRTAFEQRWGGWYVSPADTLAPHRGNAVIASPASDELAFLQPALGAFDAARYPAAGSDVVALMILEHQTQVTNLLIRLGWEQRVGTDDAKLNQRVMELARYMLFVDEPPLPRAIHGASTFSEAFAARGVADSKGRSLRALDLETRLFRYPLSYMIHSPAFEALPSSLRVSVYERLYRLLTDPDTRIANARTVVAILRDTKKDLPVSWVVPGTALEQERSIMGPR